MEVVNLIQLVMFCLSYVSADEWEITVDMSPANSSNTYTNLSVTFYERQDDGSSSPAPNVTMEISMPNASNVTIPDVKRPMKIDVWVDGNGEEYHIQQLVFTHSDTCRIFTFDCWKYAAISKTIHLISTDIMENCLPTTTTTTVAPTICSPTTATTVAPTTGSSTTTTTVAPTTGSPTTTTTVAPTTGSPTTTTTTRPTLTTNDTSLTTTPAQSNMPCCPCDPEKPMVNLTISQLQTIVTELQSQISVNKSSLSSSIRNKTCATDNRPSSRLMGMVGAVFLAIPFVLLISCDITRLFISRSQKVLVV